MQIKYLIVKYFIFTLFLFLITGITLSAQVHKTTAKNANSQGYEFYLAIPPNEVDYYYIDSSHIEFYLCSTEKTSVDIYFAGRFVKTIIVSPNSTYIYKCEVSDEVRTVETNDKNIYHLVAKDNPISVYVLNSKILTSDGYLALPVQSWGKQYIHNCYWENYEGITKEKQAYFKTGFLVIASENNTTIEVHFNGFEITKYDSNYRSDGKLVAGEIVRIQLNKGEVYRISTRGKTKGLFDISGSLVTSNNPIGIISYHERAGIPTNHGTQYFSSFPRNHLCEMLNPTNVWGQDFYTLEFKPNANTGDYFRIVSDERNNEYTISCYDVNDGSLIHELKGVLQNNRDLVEIPKFDSILSNMYANSIKGVSVIHTSKPAQVFQYCYSASILDTNCDPFMVTIPPREQYVKQTNFYIPGRDFNKNRINLLVVGDTINPIRNQKILASFQIHKETKSGDPKAYQSLESFAGKPPFSFRIPNTNIYWASINLDSGSYSIKSQTYFSGSVFGLGNKDGYGWPAGQSGVNLSEKDTLSPKIYKSGDCGRFKIIFTDSIKDVDSGVDFAPYLAKGSSNFSLLFPGNSFPNSIPQKEYSFSLEVVDGKLDAIAYLAITDLEGNTTIDSIKYNAEKLELNPTSIVDFGRMTSGITKNKLVTLSNTGIINAEIKKIYLKSNLSFKLIEGEKLDNNIFALPVKDFIKINIEYTSKFDYVPDVDSLIVIAGCDVRYSFPIIVNTNHPKIYVGDFSAGDVMVGSSINSANQLYIENPSNDTLIVYGYTMKIKDTYFIDSIQGANFPMHILPGQRKSLQYGAFAPETIGDFSTIVIFASNALEGDSISKWYGRGISGIPTIADCDFGNKRVLTQNDTTITIINNSYKPIKIESIRFENDEISIYNYSYKILTDLDGIVLPANGALNSNSRKTPVAISFTPKYESYYPTKIIVKYNHGRDSLKAEIKGNGILPKIKFSNYTFPTELNFTTQEKASATNGELFIKSNSYTSPLHIKNASIIPNLGTPQDFEISYKGVNLKSNSYSNYLSKVNNPGDLQNFDVIFKPTAFGKRFIAVKIEHDAVEGNGKSSRVDYKLDTMYVYGSGKDLQVLSNAVDFGNVLSCTDSIGLFTITNRSSNDILEIESISVGKKPNSSKDIFSIESSNYTYNVKPNSSINFKIRFSPKNNFNQNVFEDKIYVKSRYRNAKDTVNFEQSIFGKSFNSSIEVSLPSLTEVPVGEKTIYSNKFSVSAKNLNSATNWQNYNIRNITIKMIYDSFGLKYGGVQQISPGLALKNWKLTAEENLASDGKAVLTISGWGPGIIEDGELFAPEFIALLSAKSKFKIEILSVTMNEGACTDVKTNGGEISITGCVQNLMNLKFTDYETDLLAVYPSPINTNSFSINFAVGLFSAATKVELLSYSGETLKVLYSRETAAGNYVINADASELSAGEYFIKLTSGSFTKQEKIVIIK